MKTRTGTSPVHAAVLWALGAALSIAASSATGEERRRPNFLLIVADDLGFSDLGSYGGEIATPTLDQLATEGVRYTNFYVGPTCSPTRAMLLSGMDNHLVGMGNMYERTAPNQVGVPGYEGVLNLDVPTFAERLKEAGYRTYMTGKWHLGHAPTHIPRARGFDRDWSLINAAGSHFSWTGSRVENEESEFTEDGVYLTELPKNHYSSLTYTEKMIEFIKDGLADDRPWVAYLAYQAPHDPLQVPKPWLRRYKGAFDEGWDALREARLERLKATGMMPPEAELAPRLWFVPEYQDLVPAAQLISARRMEIYAAMVEYLDDQVGRLLSFLSEAGELDDTIVIFFSDNGPEGNDPIPAALKQPNLESSSFFATNYDTSFEAWGRPYGFVAYGPPWAQLSAAPFDLYKGALAEGGVRSPLIVWDGRRPGGGRIENAALLHVMDVAPTLLELAGLDPAPMQGRSWARMLRGEEASPRTSTDVIAMEFQGARMVRRGRWKARFMPRPFGNDDWQLFDLSSDPGECHDLASRHPRILAELIVEWDRYVAENNVVLPNRTSFDGMEERLPPKPPVPDSWPRGQEPNWTNRGKAR